MPRGSAKMMLQALLFLGTVSLLVSILMLNVLETQNTKFLSQQQQNHRLASEQPQQQQHNENATILMSRNETTNSNDEWPLPFIHIINTRFMQHQADLLDLARARLVLFETFCFHSVVGQSIVRKLPLETPPFLWIIKTDPQLHQDILKELVALVEPYPFIYLVASNVNYGIGINPGGWRGSQAGNDVLHSQVYSGNMTRLSQAHEARNSRVVLETRLDADDGLHVHLLEMIQREARSKLKFHSTQKGRQDWLYWCCQNHLDWSPTTTSGSSSGNSSEYGTFVPYSTTKACITAGITLGVSVGQDDKDIPRFMHHELYQELKDKTKRASCGGGHHASCLHMMEKPILSVIRSRTATSAGMRNVKMMNTDDVVASKHAVPIQSSQLIKALQHGFHVSVLDVVKVNRYMQDNVVAIAEDNLRGQCTHGHSCKNSTRKALEDLISAAKSNITTKIRT